MLIQIELGKVKCPLTGRTWEYNPHDAQEAKRVKAEAEAHNKAEIAKREKLAGRPLTARELMHGVAHHDDRPMRQRIAEDGQFTGQPAPSGNNPHRALLESGLYPAHANGVRADMRCKLEADADAWDAEQATKADQTELIESTETKAAVAHARSIFDVLRFNPNAPQSELKAAEHRLRVAQSGKADEYWQLDREWVEQAEASTERG